MLSHGAYAGFRWDAAAAATSALSGVLRTMKISTALTLTTTAEMMTKRLVSGPLRLVVAINDIQPGQDAGLYAIECHASC
jgi:hypothetical protein